LILGEINSKHECLLLSQHNPEAFTAKHFWWQIYVDLLVSWGSFHAAPLGIARIAEPCSHTLAGGTQRCDPTPE